MDDEDDPLAQIIAMLREATRTAGAAGKATHEGMRRRLPSGSPSATARRAMSGPPRASSAASFSARLFSSSPPPGPIWAEPRGRSPAASPGVRGILGATPAFAKCVAAPANSGHRDAAATGSAGRDDGLRWHGTPGERRNIERTKIILCRGKHWHENCTDISGSQETDTKEK